MDKLKITSKFCSRCKTEKPADSFSPDANTRSGLKCHCKTCRNAENRQSHADDPSKRRGMRLRRMDKIREENKQWAKDNKEKINAKTSRYRAKKREALHPDHNIKIEKDLRLKAQEMSDATGVKYEVDHIFPIAKGGPHHHENMQIISKSLNSGKQDDLKFIHPDCKHWTELPQHILDWISPESWESAYKELKNK